MKEKTWVWVPGEEHDNGVIVTDAETGRELLVTEGKFKNIDLPKRSGGTYHPRAVRAQVLETDGSHARVKLPNGEKIRIRIQSKLQFTEDGTEPLPPKAESHIAPRAKHGAW